MYFAKTMILDFFIAFGVVLGGSMLAGMGAVFTLQAPTVVMLRIADNIKIWAMVAAVGGTIDPLRIIESNVMVGQLNPAFKQILLIISAFAGAHIGTEMIHWLCREGLRQ